MGSKKNTILRASFCLSAHRTLEFNPNAYVCNFAYVCNLNRILVNYTSRGPGTDSENTNSQILNNNSHMKRNIIKKGDKRFSEERKWGKSKSTSQPARDAVQSDDTEMPRMIRVQILQQKQNRPLKNVRP